LELILAPETCNYWLKAAEAAKSSCLPGNEVNEEASNEAVNEETSSRTEYYARKATGICAAV